MHVFDTMMTTYKRSNVRSKKMANKKPVFDNEFRNNAVRYAQEHKDLSRKEWAANLGIGESTLARWLREARQSSNGTIEMRGTGNFESDEAKEVARLKRELRDTKDALEILKKDYRHTGRLTRAVYEQVEDTAEKRKEFSVSGVLEKSGISKSGYYDWKKRDKSKTAKRKERVVEKRKKSIKSHMKIMVHPKSLVN